MAFPTPDQIFVRLTGGTAETDPDLSLGDDIRSTLPNTGQMVLRESWEGGIATGGACGGFAFAQGADTHNVFVVPSGSVGNQGFVIRTFGTSYAITGRLIRNAATDLLFNIKGPAALGGGYNGTSLSDPVAFGTTDGAVTAKLSPYTHNDVWVNVQGLNYDSWDTGTSPFEATLVTPSAERSRLITGASFDSLLEPGGEIYRCVFVANDGVDATPVLNIGSDISGASVGGLEVEYGLAPEGIDGTPELIADQFTAPTGVTFSEPGTPVQIPVLAAGETHAIWIRVTVPAAFSAPTLTDGFVLGMEEDSPAGTGVFYAGGFTWQYSLAALGPYDTVELTDEVEGYLTPLDEIAITDEATAQRVTYGTIVDSASFTDATAALKVGATDIIDEVTFDDDLASAGTFHVDIEDAIAFFDLTDTSGGQREGWVLNLDSSGVSRYLWGPFTSFARYQKRHYAVTNDGVFLLEGDTDDGEDIDAFVLLALTDLGEEFKKRVKAAYLGVRSTGDLLLKVVVDETTYIYEVRTQGMDTLKRVRGTVGLGLYGNYWQFGIENADGVDFELESVKILPLKPIVDGRRKD